MNYELFISDVDGTLVRADGTISGRNIEAIAAYREAGGIFAVCTGRMLASIRPRLKDLGLDDGIVIAFQGAQVADIATGKLLKDDAFTREQALEVLCFMEENDLHVHAYAGERMLVNRQNALLEAYETMCRVKGDFSDMPLSERVVQENLRIVKMLVMCSADEQPKVEELLLKRFGETYYVTCSSEYLVEIMPKGQSKAAAVAFLSNYYKVPVEKIAAIGDQKNDIPLVASAGGKFAVANAVKELKEFATVVPSVEEDGVAYAIEKYAME